MAEHPEPHSQPSVLSDDVADLLTVEEAAALLRIGRRKAYELAARFEATGGREGLPVVRLGRCLRVVRVRLEQFLLADPHAPAPQLRGMDGGRRSRR
ncbi:MAG: helix-turn-helix domain-containing protein [Actinomycetota bacterium]|nr:helix-turn-helix domain-containing protein [Actinomycetota bacterium]MDQ3640923.1 helix-turn-helix domain-containing protein [Actinomycetota bacterium]